MIDGARRRLRFRCAVRGRARLVLRAPPRQPAAAARWCRRTSPSLDSGVIRGLHYHERGQDDLFACLAGMARVVVLDRASGEAFSARHRRREPRRRLRPGPPRARLRGADRLPLHLPRHRGVRPGRSGRAHAALERSSGQAPVEHRRARSSPRRDSRASSITGAGGQLGAALAEAFPWAARYAHAQWELDARPPTSASGRSISFSTLPPGPTSTVPRQTSRRRGRQRRSARSGSCSSERRSSTTRPTTSSTDASGAVRRVRRARARSPPTGARSSTASGRSATGWIVRTLVAVRLDGSQLRPDDARARPRAGRGARRRRPARLPDLRRAISPRRPGASSSSVRPLPRGRGRRLHLGRFRGGDLRGGGPRLPRRARSRPRSSAARRRGPPTRCCAARSPTTPRLPHWREGLRRLPRAASHSGSTHRRCACSSPAAAASSAATSSSGLLARGRRGRRPRQADVCGQPGQSRRSRRASWSDGDIADAGRGRGRRARAATRSSTSPPRPTSTARSSARRSSSTRTCSGRTSCSSAARERRAAARARLDRRGLRRRAAPARARRGRTRCARRARTRRRRPAGTCRSSRTCGRTASTRSSPGARTPTARTSTRRS